MRDASTVLLLRDHAEAGLEVFMVQRHGRSRFMGGAHVFPGGKLDEADVGYAGPVRLPAKPLPITLGEPALDPARALGLFVAAARETFEEAGVLFAEPLGDASFRHEARGLLLEDERPLLPIATEAGWTLCLDELVPQARWITPKPEPRRYDTRFFVARAPDQLAQTDERETLAGRWFTPAAAITANDTKEIQLPPPTLRTLVELARFASVEACLAHTRATPPPCIEPVHFPADDGEGYVIAFNGDPKHPVAEPAFPGSTRVVLRDGRWREG